MESYKQTLEEENLSENIIEEFIGENWKDKNFLKTAFDLDRKQNEKKSN